MSAVALNPHTRGEHLRSRGWTLDRATALDWTSEGSAVVDVGRRKGRVAMLTLVKVERNVLVMDGRNVLAHIGLGDDVVHLAALLNRHLGVER